MIILLVLVFAAIAFLDIPNLIRGKYWRELAVFLFFYTLSFSLFFLHFMGVALPSPIKGVIFILKDVLHLAYKAG